MTRAPDSTFVQRSIRALPVFLAFAAAFPFTLVFMITVASYWRYFDMGIGSAANGFVLFLCYGPVMLLSLLLLATCITVLLWRRLGAWLRLGAVAGAMALSVSGAFAAEAHRTEDYPGLRQEKSTADFGRWFVRRWFGRSPKRSNQAIQRTAGRAAFPLTMTSTFDLQPNARSPAVADLVLVR